MLEQARAGIVDCGEEPPEEQVFRQDITLGECCTLKHSVPEGLHPMERTCAGAVNKRLTEAEKEQQRQGVMN